MAASRRSACRGGGGVTTQPPARATVASAWASIDPPGPDVAREVAGRGLHADGLRRHAEELGDRGAHLPAGARRSAAARRRIVRSTATGRQPASASRPTTPRSSSLLAIPAARSLVGRVDGPEVAEAARAEQRAGDGVERGVAVGVAVEARRGRDLHAAEPEPVARAERVRVGREARPSLRCRLSLARRRSARRPPVSPVADGRRPCGRRRSGARASR